MSRYGYNMYKSMFFIIIPQVQNWDERAYAGITTSTACSITLIVTVDNFGSAAKSPQPDILVCIQTGACF